MDREEVSLWCSRERRRRSSGLGGRGGAEDRVGGGGEVRSSSGESRMLIWGLWGVEMRWEGGCCGC